MAKPISTATDKCLEEHHRLKISCDRGCEMLLIRGGPKLAYLWFGDKAHNCVDTVSGEKPLRALAEAILKELEKPATKRRTRR